MSFRTRLQHTIQVQRIGESGTDRYNNPVKVVEETLTYPAWFEWAGGSGRAASNEDNNDRETRISTASVILGPEVQVQATDRLLYDGLEFEVVGRPTVVSNHHGLHHQIVNLKLIEG